MNKLMIETRNLSKKFGNLWAVRDLNLKVYKREIFILLGPNGAGKTTTLKLLTGLLKPDSGIIEIGDYDIQKQPLEVKRLLSYIPDEPYLYEKLTGREFLEFVCGLYKISRREYIDKISKYIEYFNMSSYINKLVQDYSHGMKQRLVFTSALIHNPEVLIIDEPLVGLDPASAKKVKTLLKNESIQGLTVLISTHTLSFAEELASRIGIIDKGKLVAVGAKDDLRKESGIEGTLEEIFLKLTSKKDAEDNI